MGRVRGNAPQDQKPLTDRAVSLAIGKLEELRRQGQDPNAVLDQSTLHNWQGAVCGEGIHQKPEQVDKWACLSDGSLLSQAEVRDVNDPFAAPPKQRTVCADREHGHA